MRDAVLVGAALLAVGALFVWLRGASRSDQLVEDSLDEFEPDPLEPEPSPATL
jgi:hypothetical protein